MIVERVSKEALTKAVGSLARPAQVAFGLSCAERLYPNYLAFKRASGWGTPDALRRGLDIAWHSLAGGSVDSSALKLALEELEAAEPETEDFDTILVSSALDAASCASLLLQFLESSDLAHLIEIGSLCRDTVDMFIHDQELESNDPDLEDKIFSHRLMQAELLRQQQDVAELRSFSGTAAEVEQLRTRWRKPLQSNIEQVA